jgi:hypothetical protein
MRFFGSVMEVEHTATPYEYKGRPDKDSEPETEADAFAVEGFVDEAEIVMARSKFQSAGTAEFDSFSDKGDTRVIFGLVGLLVAVSMSSFWYQNPRLGKVEN